MSLFDFPRINITGSVQLNPGTANNDDNAGALYLKDGQTLALFNSATVQPITFGMPDADFVDWVQHPQVFSNSPTQWNPQPPTFPAEWNYYGDLSTTVSSASVIGVTAAPGQVLTAPDPNVPASALVGATLTYGGGLTDVNPQGSPPATQFFIPQLTLTSGSQVVLQGPASKGVCQWINFFRNVNAQADQGAGGYVYHVMLKSQCTTFALPGFDDPSIVGAIFRYYLYNPNQTQLTNEQMVTLYQQQGQNPLNAQFIATIAPLRADETITSGPVGRLLAAQSQNITTPTSNNNGGGKVALAPAMLQQSGNAIAVDFIGTFPDNYQSATSNDKFDFGAVNLIVTGNGTTATVASVDYTNTNGGNQAGWLFDYDVANNAEAQNALCDPNASFSLQSAKFETVLDETQYYFVTNQLSIYAEQGGANNSFLNQGTYEPATISVYSRGTELTAENCPPISVWSYATVPLQTPGPAVLVTSDWKPGVPLVADTSAAGNLNYIFSIGSDQPPAANWSAFIVALLMTNSTSISLRILPTEDFSQYYVDASAATPVANPQLTFPIVFQAVLRPYYLLFPVMNGIIDLSSETAVAAHAKQIVNAIDPSNWMQMSFMPRTRDMSAARRALLTAWCNSVPPQTRA